MRLKAKIEEFNFCGLFYDAVSISLYMTSMTGWLVVEKLEITWSGQTWSFIPAFASRD